MNNICAIIIAALLVVVRSEVIKKQTYVYNIGTGSDVAVTATYVIAVASGQSYTTMTKSISGNYRERPVKDIKVTGGPRGPNGTTLQTLGFTTHQYSDGFEKVKANPFPREGPGEFEMVISFTVSPGLCLDRARAGHGARVVMHSQLAQWWKIRVEKTVFNLVFPVSGVQDVCMIPEDTFEGRCYETKRTETPLNTTFVFETGGKSDSAGFSWPPSMYGDGVDLPGCDGFDDSSAMLPTTPMWKGSSVLQVNASGTFEQNASSETRASHVKRKPAKNPRAFLSASMMQLMQRLSSAEQAAEYIGSDKNAGKLEL